MMVVIIIIYNLFMFVVDYVLGMSVDKINGTTNDNDGGIGMEINIDGVVQWSSTFLCPRPPASV